MNEIVAGADKGEAAATGGTAAAAPGAAAPDANTEFASALREATAAKNGDKTAAETQAAEDKKPDADGAAAGADKKGDPAETAGAADKSAGAETAASKAAAASPKPADIVVDWSKVKPALKAAYDAGSPELKTALEAEIVKGLKRGQEIVRLKDTVSQGKHRRSPASTSSRPARGASDLKKVLTGTAMAALDKDAPEVTAALREAVGPLVAELENANKHLDGLAREDLAAEAEFQEGQLAEAHPDWDTVTGSKEFADWMGKAAPYVKAMIDRNAVVSPEFPNGRIVDGKEAALVLTLFKDSTGFGSAAGDSSPAAGKPAEGSHQPSPVDKKRALQQESARMPDTKGLPAASGVAEDDFAGNLREATRLKALERQRQHA